MKTIISKTCTSKNSTSKKIDVSYFLKKQLLVRAFSVLFLVSLPFNSQAANPQVKLETNFGDIILELNSEKAPNTVKNFLKYVNSGFYDNTIFHRIIDGFMIQGGGFNEEYKKKPTNPPIENEADNKLKNVVGSIAMARTSAPHTATAQFFINVSNNDSLNYSGPTMRGWACWKFFNFIYNVHTLGDFSKYGVAPAGPFSKDVPASPVIIIKATQMTGISSAQ